MIEGTIFRARAAVEVSEATRFVDRCPDCGEGLVRRDGCLTCVSCGYSRCG